LERRPDIRQAEQQLIASNARIGVAKAAYFPQITLTADAGYQSSALTSIFQGPAGLWSFGGALTQPIFEGGRLRNKRAADRSPEKGSGSGLSTDDSGSGFERFPTRSSRIVKNQEFRAQQELLTNSAQGAAHLSDVRYQGGDTSYLEVLTNQTNYFSAELNLAQARLNELLALVGLYKALGGGWQQ